MNQKRLNEILVVHKAWLEGKPEGHKAELRGVDLRKADLRKVDLQKTCLCGVDLRGADLRGACLRGADLRGACLRGADIDYSCWPLWCGSLDVKVDARIAAQLAYHFCRLDCDDPGYIAARNAIIDFANTFHRVMECGKLRPRRNADC